MFGILELFVLTSLLLGSVSAQKASVSIEPGSSPDVRGLLNIAVVDSGVMITGRITGLTPGLHGFHIHEKGDLGNACKNAGPHFNPFQLAHGDPKSPQRHIGDLGNIVADASGTAFIDIFDDRASMDPNSQAYIGNRAIVVHASPDDLGRGFDEESKKTGNAGARVGCGLINIDLTSQSPYPFQGYPMQVPGRNIDQIQPAHVIPFQIQQQDTLGSRLVPSIGASSISPGLGAIGNVLIIPGSSNTVQGQLEVADVTGGITIRGSISGLTPGLHGFHIHEKGELGNQCRDALGHFNPFNLNHGDPRDFERHVGDLGNIEAGANGVAYIDIFDPKASLSPRSLAYVGNRAMVVHAAPDDLGRGPNEESLKTGNAGARVGCGVIEVRPSSSSFHREIQRPITFPFGLPTYNQPIRPYQPYQPYGFLF